MKWNLTNLIRLLTAIKRTVVLGSQSESKPICGQYIFSDSNTAFRGTCKIKKSSK